MPRGPLSQLALYPAAAMEAAERASVLLSKVLQLVQSLGLSEREVRYLLTEGADAFDNLEFDNLPWRDAQTILATIAAGLMKANSSRTKEQALQKARDDNSELATEADRVTPHFRQFRRLAAYARLKRNLAGGTDDLIAIFEANGTTAADRLEKQVYSLVARLTRRDEATIKATAEALVKAPAVPMFESERPLWRLWEALQVVERFGVPPSSLLAWSEIIRSDTTGARRFELARDVKAALKARFEPETWQRVAQPIFDKLRPRQRDALVSYILQQMSNNPETTDIDTQDKLFEYFLIDPGMEPVVQTSRIRLAIGSLQLFIQRCLLNLERRVHPSTINSEQWEWMKRYRVWEANRKIFLFPENWLEPEFRDDKTHLFTELEGALLQGDVSSDLVEDAFLKYLKQLDELARLDICAMHIEDNGDPALPILHVFGRTFSQPHKYFYRRYAHQMWTPWEPVSAAIEGDHLAPVVWRDRLYLFWVTFLDQADPDPSTDGTTGSQKLTDVVTGELITYLKAVVAKKRVDVQLHWSEYLGGEWSTHESAGYSSEVITKIVPASFSRNNVFVHVSKEYDPADSAELGVYVYMDGEIDSAFYLASRNSAPESALYRRKPANPFTSANQPGVNRYSGRGALTATFGEWKPTILTTNLVADGSYTVLPRNLVDPEAAFQAPKLVVPDFGYNQGWRIDAHPRFLADLTGNGRADIVGFFNDGVHVALSNDDGTFTKLDVFPFFGSDATWKVDDHPRFLADLTGNGLPDIVGFAHAAVHVALNKGGGTFDKPKDALHGDFGFGNGWNKNHPRFLADLTGDGRADIVGFFEDGVHVALNEGAGNFRLLGPVFPHFGTGSDWQPDKHPRFLADLTGDGCPDIVGFGDAGVHVALSNRDGTFRLLDEVFPHFGTGPDWQSDKHPRFLADLTGDGCADIVGFGDAGVHVALNDGKGAFRLLEPVFPHFGTGPAWQPDKHPRFLADLTGDGRADIVGFSYEGVWVALNKGDGTFHEPELVLPFFGYDAGEWRVAHHPRFLADLTGDGRADIVGFHDDGVWVARHFDPFPGRLDETALLRKPVFYQDKWHTLFVESVPVDQTIQRRDGWVARPTQPALNRKVPEISVIPEIPRKVQIPYPEDPGGFSINPGSLHNPPPDRDWLVKPGSVVKFDSVLIGPNGQPGVEIQFAGVAR